MKSPIEVKLDVPSQEIIDKLASDAPPLGMRCTPLKHSFHRDIYFDSRDKTLEKRGVSCRLRTRSDDKRILSLEIRQTQERQVHEEEVPEVDPHDVLRGSSDPARRLRAIIDPDRLEPTIELEIERRQRRLWRGWLPFPQFELVYDIVAVRSEGDSRYFYELKIRHLRGGKPSLEAVVRDFRSRYALRTTLSRKVDRARKKLASLESRALAGEVHGIHEVAVIATYQGEIGMRRAGNALVLPVEQGNGEETCRGMLRANVGTAEGEVWLLGVAPAAATRPLLEVWLADDFPRSAATPPEDGVKWFTLPDIMRRVGSPLLRDARTLAALAVAVRSDLFQLKANPMATEKRAPAATSTASDTGTQTLADLQKPELPEESLHTWEPVPDQFINEELSWLEFNARVLELAEDPGTPLLARFRFLAIFSSNLDEFVMVRIGILKQEVLDGVVEKTVDGLTPQEQLDAISVRLNPLMRRQQHCFRKLVPELERHGVALRQWDDLDPPTRDAMRAYFDEQIFPVLTPQAMTQAPGHPFPHITNLSLALAAMVRDEDGGALHFAHIRIPGGLPRFVPSEAGAREWIGATSRRRRLRILPTSNPPTGGIGSNRCHGPRSVPTSGSLSGRVLRGTSMGLGSSHTAPWWWRKRATRLERINLRWIFNWRAGRSVPSSISTYRASGRASTSSVSTASATIPRFRAPAASTASSDARRAWPSGSRWSPVPT